MEILYLLIPLSLVFVFIIGAIFWWSLGSGQFDDLDGPGYRVLMDDDRSPATIDPGPPDGANNAPQRTDDVPAPPHI